MHLKSYIWKSKVYTHQDLFIINRPCISHFVTRWKIQCFFCAQVWHTNFAMDCVFHEIVHNKCPKGRQKDGLSRSDSDHYSILRWHHVSVRSSHFTSPSTVCFKLCKGQQLRNIVLHDVIFVLQMQRYRIPTEKAYNAESLLVSWCNLYICVECNFVLFPTTLHKNTIESVMNICYIPWC